MDNSNIYVRERGNLRRVSDIVLAQPKPVSSSCRRTNPFVLRKEHFIFTYNAEGSLRYTTKSLFDITLLFVADNIHHVDSLVGFPEQIGDRLFAAAEENRVFLNADISPKALQLFSDAYGDMVLGSLCLRNRFPLLHERMDEIKTFHSLKSLDLFGCRLGDEHEIFQHLTSSSLASSLIQLFIGGNSLSDVGLQRLTAPIRMLRKGLDCLQLLDVSHNPISVRTLRYLTCLPKLENLDVSGTSLKLDTGLKTTIWDLLGLIYSEKPLDTFDHSRCKTEGWAEQVVNQWETNNSQMPKQKKIDESRTSALRFFGRQKFVREVLKARPLVCESEEEDKRERLHFFRPAANSHIPDKQTPSTTKQQAKPSWHNVKKRQRQSESCDSSRQSPPMKRLSSSAPLTVEDIDLLNSY
ncbi:leucine-rich repeat-containing protein 42 isoform X1 [Sebastes umbrosus]|uniref:leucine-rich repeat-containing protein 42 isoform X1 n=1 Tax=Sebastes umbrosus TaxID=72105 RepID=UPI00189EC855|nr:leucine-rich repeat-containing protein 42 isoform X1 [Sebastes umbrosus]XP_037643255.1 leucine-rich repeat-containing protein 42 isoform X1 [Sebastes umbrosus]XP_037643257.1 leucine-rich repeat-containing protein 42 isoform X1 [Sebastes umbrosus]XP_037643258.1 leucine-rich repeat-containing protein 42 isoform X1 [Sebastes umbrosus]